MYLAIGFIVAQSCMYLAIAYFSKITTFFIKPKWLTRVFWFVISISVVAVVLSIVYFSHPIYDTTTGITNWDIQPIVGIVSMIIFAGVLIPSAIFFFWQGVKSKDITVKTRSVAISIGLLLLIITAYTYYTASTQLAALTSDLFSLLSYLTIFFGVIYRRDSSPSLNSINNNE